MSAFKSVADIIEVAIRIERQGMAFYKELYARAESPEARDVFAVLAAQEEMHTGLFRKILAETVDYTPRYDYPGEYGLFLNDCAAAVLKKVAAGIEAVTADSYPTTLDLGIAFEKESILFYLELLDEGALTEEKGRLVKRIIDEERRHVQMLAALKTGLKL